MQNTSEQKKEWYDPIVEFAAHFIAASVIFLMLGAFTAGLHFYIEWLKSWKVDPVFVYTFKGLEYFVFATDVVLFVVYVGGSAIKAIQTMIKRWMS
ncbi:MAG: hypothetical protein ACREQ7_06755 [Candidatus Binatia bacterium]